MAAPSYLRDQFNRSSSSIALNLAEGSARPSKRDQSRFYSIALGSLRESQAILEMIKPEPASLKIMANHLGGSIFSLIRATETADEKTWHPKPKQKTAQKTEIRTENPKTKTENRPRSENGNPSNRHGHGDRTETENDEDFTF